MSTTFITELSDQTVRRLPAITICYDILNTTEDKTPEDVINDIRDKDFINSVVIMSKLKSNRFNKIIQEKLDLVTQLIFLLFYS